MKKLAIIKNPLFNNYIKLLSAENLEEILDNPNIPIPFICINSIELSKADEISSLLNDKFLKNKIKGKDFIEINEEVEKELNFLFSILNLSIQNEENEKLITKKNSVDMIKFGKQEDLEEKKVEELKISEGEFNEDKKENISEISLGEKKEEPNNESDSLPLKQEINFAKKESITAILIDEKTVIFEEEEMSIIEATKKAFKKAGISGLALGLSNWNYKGKNLKTFK